MVKQIEGKHNLYINMLMEKQSTMKNGRLKANIQKKFLWKRVGDKINKYIKWWKNVRVNSYISKKFI